MIIFLSLRNKSGSIANSEERLLAWLINSKKINSIETKLELWIHPPKNKGSSTTVFRTRGISYIPELFLRVIGN